MNLSSSFNQKVCQVDHLLLLVGKNPLPNAIAGKLLAKTNGAITLICSEDTAPVADKLRKWFGRKGIEENRVHKCEVEEANAGDILRKLLTTGGQQHVGVLNDYSEAQSIGLNYTGGTKAMAVHAYHAVQQWAKSEKNSKRIKPSFSYLDARTLSLIFDPDDPESGKNSRSEYVGVAVQLGIGDLLTLHGWTLSDCRKDAVLPDTAKAMWMYYVNLNGTDSWRGWKDQNLQGKCRLPKDRRKWKDPSVLAGIDLNVPHQPELEEIGSCLANELGLSLGSTTFNIGQAVDGLKPRKFDEEDLCKWLDGCWLESVVLLTLKDLEKPCGLLEIRMNLEPISSARKTHMSLRKPASSLMLPHCMAIRCLPSPAAPGSTGRS